MKDGVHQRVQRLTQCTPNHTNKHSLVWRELEAGTAGENRGRGPRAGTAGGDRGRGPRAGGGYGAGTGAG